MSYSFSIRAANKTEAKAKVSDELRKVVQAQAIHEADVQQAQAAAHAFIHVVDDLEDKDVTVNVHGSIGSDGEIFTRVNFSVGVALVAKEPAAGDAPELG